MQKAGNQIKLVIYLPEDLLNVVDTKRGIIPRSAYIRQLMINDTGFQSTPKKSITSKTV